MRRCPLVQQPICHKLVFFQRPTTGSMERTKAAPNSPEGVHALALLPLVVGLPQPAVEHRQGDTRLPRLQCGLHLHRLHQGLAHQLRRRSQRQQTLLKRVLIANNCSQQKGNSWMQNHTSVQWRVPIQTSPPSQRPPPNCKG